MSDPLIGIAAALGRLARSGMVRLAHTDTGRQMMAKAAGVAAAGVTAAAVGKLRERGVNVPNGVATAATAAAGMAGSVAGAHLATPPVVTPPQAGAYRPAGRWSEPARHIPAAPHTGWTPTPTYSYASTPPPASRWVPPPPERMNPYQGPRPMVPDVVIDKPPPIPMPPPPPPIVIDKPPPIPMPPTSY